MLTEREIPASYADRERFTSLFNMYILKQGFTLSAQGYFCCSAYDALPATMLKDSTYSTEKLEATIAELPKIASC